MNCDASQVFLLVFSLVLLISFIIIVLLLVLIVFVIFVIVLFLLLLPLLHLLVWKGLTTSFQILLSEESRGEYILCASHIL